MKVTFSNNKHNEFKSYFNIKDTPSIIEDNYYKKTRKYINYIKWIPWLKMIWIWNSISMNCASENSDIDLFIVTSQDKLWFVRVIITIIFILLWVRKTKNKHAWKFCLSFFATTNWLNFWDFAIKNKKVNYTWKEILIDDIYLYFWIIYFKPILDYNNTYELFLEKNNSWADFTKYNKIFENNKKYIKFNSPSLLGMTLGAGLNILFKKIFLPKTIKHFNKIWKPFWVIINDNMLKFHNNDIRKKTRNKLTKM